MEQQHILGPLLGRTTQLVKERMEARLSGYDITPAQAHTLLYLHACGGKALQCEVVRHLNVKAPTANGILSRMEEKSLVVRSVSDCDARQKWVILTEKGTLLRDCLQLIFADVEQMMLTGFSNEEQATVFTSLERMIQNLEEDRHL